MTMVSDSTVYSGLPHILALIIRYKYGMILVAALLEGPTIGVFCGFLLRLGYFHFWGVYLILMSADLVGDVVWYVVGYYGARKAVDRYGKLVSLGPETVAKIETKFRAHPNSTILISKMTAGFGFAILVLLTAGMIRLPVKNYAIMSVLGGFVWSALLMSVGYFFGGLYGQIDNAFRIIALMVFSILTLALIYGFGKYMRNRTESN